MRLPAINPTARRVRLVSKAAKRLPVQNNLMKAVQPRDRAERVEGLITSGATARELEAVAKVLKKRGRSKLLPLEILVVVSAFLTQDTA
ncbi:MAG TPA: hypothetical protein VEY30_12925, partial [Myxococcaceae bacterium]|nr:hypothetical protein [Myxococcaceae bacterium]